MRVNVYAEEVTSHIEIVEKKINDLIFVGVRFHLELPAQWGQAVIRGPFLTSGADRSSAVTFWGDWDSLTRLFLQALDMVDKHGPASVDSPD